MLKLVDRLASGASARKSVSVQIRLRAPSLDREIFCGKNLNHNYNVYSQMYILNYRQSFIIKPVVVYIFTLEHNYIH